MVDRNLVIRALTYFAARVNDINDLKKEMDYQSSVLSEVERSLLNKGYTIFTKRVSFTGLPRGLQYHLLDYVNKELLISTGYSERLQPTEIVELAKEGIYIPILHMREPDANYASLYADIFHRASSVDPIVSTRIAIGFHDDRFQSPYFPDSSSQGHRSIGLAFLYPKTIIEYVKKGRGLREAFAEVFKLINSVVRLVNENSGLPVYVDYSLSPWMDNSVVEIYDILKYSIIESGALYFTWFLNKIIYDLSDVKLRIGFNEVMLPYAEDTKLRDYGARGLIKARDFLSLASVCVAGIDMIVVPENRDEMRKFILSSMVLSQIKTRPMSLRVIPVQSNPGDVIDLKKFGKITVIPY